MIRVKKNMNAGGVQKIKRKQVWALGEKARVWAFEVGWVGSTQESWVGLGGSI